MNKELIVKLKEVLYLLFVRYPLTLYGVLRGNLIKTHWGRGLNNFGDCLSPHILRYYGFTPVFSQQDQSDIVMAGSILQWVPKDYSGIILGTGGADVEHVFPKARILGVRGYKTLANLKSPSEMGVIGDPGLIINKVFPEVFEKKYKLGIVPHFVDKNHDVVRKWEKAFGSNCLLIDVLKPVPDVVKKIKSCEYVISSSLHGLIVADAFGIPNIRFVIRETMPTQFFDFKYQDYYSSLNTTDMPIDASGEETMDFLVSQARLFPHEISILQQKLDETLSELRLYLR